VGDVFAGGVGGLFCRASIYRGGAVVATRAVTATGFREVGWGDRLAFAGVGALAWALCYPILACLSSSDILLRCLPLTDAGSLPLPKPRSSRKTVKSTSSEKR
jgi:hypothetical protein